MNKLHVSALLAVIAGSHLPPARADFINGYETNQWTLTNSAVDVAGSVNLADAPTSITITGGDNQVAGETDFTLTVPRLGTIYFDWTYTTSDSSGLSDFDPFGYLLNGVFTVLTSVGELSPPTTQSGRVGVNVQAGDVFGFRAQTFDGYSGAATTVITNFVPEPASAALLAIGLAVLRRRGGEARPAGSAL